MGTAVKWYIELPQHSFVNFGSLATAFLMHFQLPIRYETPPPTFLIIFMSGEGGEGLLSPLFQISC